MNDFWMLFIFGTLCIFIAYGLGYQIGFDKGQKDKYYEALLEQAEKIMEITPGKTYLIKEDKDVKL